MTYDEGLAQRIRECLDGIPDVVEKKMFGGIAFMLQGNMAVGVTDEALMVRVGPDAYEVSLQLPGVRPFDMTGRPMAGWIVVGGEAIEEDADLRTWVERGRRFASTLPPK